MIDTWTEFIAFAGIMYVVALMYVRLCKVTDENHELRKTVKRQARQIQELKNRSS